MFLNRSTKIQEKLLQILFTILFIITKFNYRLNLKISKKPFSYLIDIPDNRFKISSIASPQSTFNINIGASRLIPSDLITIFLLYILKIPMKTI